MPILLMRRKIFCAGLDVFLERLLGKVEHVRAVERLSGFGELLFAGRQQAVNPRQEASWRNGRYSE